MTYKTPNTPFSTRLSGSAKELELRLRNIFQWKKKRPPVIFFLLAAVIALSCGSLIGFSAAPRNGTLGEVYRAYFAKNPTSRIDYENKETAYPGIDSENESFGDALEYVCAMEICSVSGHKQYIGDFDNRNGAVVLRSEAGEELWIDLYRTGYVVVSSKGAGRLDRGDDARVFKVSEDFDTEVFLSCLSAEQQEIGRGSALDAAEEEGAGDGHERLLRLATVDGLSHMPLDELPQEVLDSLTLVSESDLSISYNAEWGYYRTYTSPGLEVTTSAPSAAYLEYLQECGREESVEGEEGREWIIRATIRDDRYATLDGLKVGMACAQAEAAGYTLGEGTNFLETAARSV